MKMKSSIMKVLATLVMIVAGMLGAQAQVGGLTNTGDMSVCLNATEDYGVPDNPTSSYTWKINDETVSPTSDWIITSTGHNTISVEWKKAGSYVLTVQETTDKNCPGPVTPINVVVNPLPEVDPITAAVCSDAIIGVVLPTADKNSIPLVKYDITAAVDPALVGTATTGTDITDINAIMNDKFTNTTTGDLTVVYTVTPYSASCAGTPFTITVTISSGPQVDPMLTNACSDIATDVLLPVMDKNNAFTFTKYDITAVVDPGLTGTATIGVDITDVNIIKNDIFTNDTNADLTVVYTVTPYSASCVGTPFTITITVNPVVKTPVIYHK